MNLFDFKNADIFNSQISRYNTKVSKVRTTATFELELPIENGGVSYISENCANITPNIIIFAKPGQKRHTKFPFKCYYIHLNIYDKELLETATKLPNFINIDNNEEFVLIFKSILKHSNFKTESEKYLVYSQIFKLLHLLIRKVDFSKPYGDLVSYNDSVNAAINYIDTHLSEKLCLESIASEVSLSPIYFHNLFKSATGTTLHNYIEQKRIKKAIHLMQTTEKTLTEIAYESGFCSQSYFSYAFKRKMNTTPRNYIRLLNEKYNI